MAGGSSGRGHFNAISTLIHAMLTPSPSLPRQDGYGLEKLYAEECGKYYAQDFGIQVGG